MNDNNSSGDKTLHMSQTKTLSLKRPVEQGVVRQSFSHGRTKAVVVEKVKRRLVGPGETPTASEVAPVVVKPVVQPTVVAAAPPPPPPRPAAPPPSSRPSGVVLRTLTEDERDARSMALIEARKREEIERRQADAETKVRSEREAAEKI